MKKNTYRQSLAHAAILLCVAIVAYWQISFNINCLKWDMIDVVLPFRYYIGECWQNGIFPFWNPYQLAGTPIYPDMQYPVFYPETFLLGFISGYTNITLHLLFIFYIFVAGFGMYSLSVYFGSSTQASLLAGIAYMLSGFFTGHGQAMFAIISAAWIPFVLLYYLKMIQRGKIRHVLATSIFMFLLISNGYQTFSIILGYFLLFISMVWFIRLIITKKYNELRKLLWVNFLFFIITTLLCSPLIISLIQVSAYTSRLGYLPLSLALQNPFSPQSILSWVVPAAVVKNMEFFNTDISMANAYSGLVMLVFLFLSVFRKKNMLEWIFLSWAVFSLLASFGGYTPLREFLYHYLPLMNLFRAPSYFTLFTLIGFLLTAAKSLSDFSITDRKQTQTLRFIIILFAVLLIFLAGYSFPEIYFRKSALLMIFSDFYYALKNTTFYEHLFIHSLVQLCISGLLYFYIFIKKQFSIKWTGLILLLEMVIAVQFNIYYTVVSHKSPRELKANLRELPKGFPLPGQSPVIENSDISGAFLPVWRNTNIFHKKISFEGFSSFVFDNFARLADDYPKLKNAVLSNPPAYLSSYILPLSQLNDSAAKDSNMLYVADSFYSSHKKYFTITGSAIHVSTVKFNSFSPTCFQLEINSGQPQMLTILQSGYHGWTVTVNNIKKPVVCSNLLFMSVEIPAGKSTVIFRYSNKLIVFAFIFSLVAFFLSSLYLIVTGIRS